MSTTQAPVRTRLRALDAARALAIFGMVIVNVGAAESDGAEALVLALLSGRAAILFIVLAGVGVTILAQRSQAKGQPLWPAVLWRAGLMLVMGLSLQLLPTDVNVILTLYAALFIVALGAVRISTLWLLTGAIAATFVGPIVYILLRSQTDLPRDGAAAWGRDLLEIVTTVSLTGPYPLLVWIAPFLFGMWLGRLDLRDLRIQRVLVSAGAIAAGGAYLLSWVVMHVLAEPNSDNVGFDRLASAQGHSQMPLWLISAAGSSALLIGLMLLLIPRFGAWASPLTITGQMALTAYCLHLIAIAVFVRPETDSPNKGLMISLLIIIGLIAFCAAWRLIAPHGPLEALLRIQTPLRKRRSG